MTETWPPTEWDEADFHRDEETRLPKTLYPFEIVRARDRGGNAIGGWVVGYNPERDLLPARVLGEFPDFFDAFEAMVAGYRAWFPTRPLPRVYFIGAHLRPGAMVKIGHSVNPSARLRTLQTSHHERLEIFATVEGGKRDEEAYHRRWQARRRTGEWFVLGDCIIDVIKRLQSGGAR